MSTVKMVEYEDAGPEVRAVYDDLMATRGTTWVNNFWKALAVNPVLLEQTWETLKKIMGPGALDPMTKEMIYIAVSATNGCSYCVNSHTAAARKKGMTEEMLAELLAVTGMANQTNTLIHAMQVDLDEPFKNGGRTD